MTLLKKYSLLLHDILTETDEKHIDYESVKHAIIKLDPLSNEISATEEEFASREMLLQLENSITGLPHPLYDATSKRKLIRQGMGVE